MGFINLISYWAFAEVGWEGKVYNSEELNYKIYDYSKEAYIDLNKIEQSTKVKCQFEGVSLNENQIIVVGGLRDTPRNVGTAQRQRRDR